MARKKRSRGSRSAKRKQQTDQTSVVAEVETPVIGATELVSPSPQDPSNPSSSSDSCSSSGDPAITSDGLLSPPTTSAIQDPDDVDKNEFEEAGECYESNDSFQDSDSFQDDDSFRDDDSFANQVEHSGEPAFESQDEPPVPAISVSDAAEQNAVLLAIEDNTRLLEGLISRLDSSAADRSHDSTDPSSSALVSSSSPDGQVDNRDWQVDELEKANDLLSDQNAELERTIHRLKLQLDQHTADAKLDGSGENAGDSGTSSLSWEEQKEAILAQMEADQFDAENFIETLSSHSEEDWSIDTDIDPREAVIQLFENLNSVRNELNESIAEIKQLKRTLAEKAECPSDGQTATGAAAIASIFNNDELIAEERVRLKELQTEYQEKFRKIEVETSVERAALARERRELTARVEELESELTQVKRENKTAEDTGHANRRWLAKLGLDSSS